MQGFQRLIKVRTLAGLQLKSLIIIWYSIFGNSQSPRIDIGSSALPRLTSLSVSKDPREYTPIWHGVNIPYEVKLRPLAHSLLY